MNKEKIFLKQLEKLKFPHGRDDVGNIVFQTGGKTYVLYVEPEDKAYFRLALPRIWKVNSLTEHFQVLEALNQMNTRFKTVKMFVFEDHAWMVTEALLERPEQVSSVLERCLATFDAVLPYFRPTLGEVQDKYNFELNSTTA